MTNHRLQNSEEQPTTPKRKRVLAEVSQDIVTSEDDDNVADGMDICQILENHSVQHRQTTTSSALRALGETIRNTLLEINEIREQNRERRHRELLQILTKMVQQDSTAKNELANSKVTNLNQENFTNISHDATTSKFVKEELLVKEQYFNQDQVVLSSSNSGNFDIGLNHSNFSKALSKTNPVDIATSIEKSTAKYIKILPKSPATTSSDAQQVGKINHSVIAVKQDNTKKELEKMRAQMLELQRKKMEDRERKKREFLQMQNM